jgi:hypothetical protein
MGHRGPEAPGSLGGSGDPSAPADARVDAAPALTTVGRRALVTGAVGTALLITTASCTGSRPSPPPRLLGAPLSKLMFSVQSHYRPFAVVAPQFTTASQYVGPSTSVFLTDSSPAAPYAGVEVEVGQSDGTVVCVGLANAHGDHVLATYERTTRRAAIDVRVRGRSTLVAQRRIRLPASLRLGFVLCENQVTVVADAGEGWQPLLTERNRVAAAIDFRDPTTLATYRFAWGARPRGGSPAHLGTARAGLFGMTGIRDPHLVQHANGRPYQRDGSVYLTATCAGMGGFAQAHWGVFALDLAKPTRLRPVAKLFTARDGLILGDHAGQLVRDQHDEHWIVVNSSWGDFPRNGIHARHTTSGEDLLSGVHVLPTQRAPLPTTLSTWDPGLTRIDGRWHVSFVESASQRPFDFHPALAVAQAGRDWTVGLRRVGAATGLHQCEGPILTSVDGHWWLLASDGDDRRFPIFDLDMRYVGRLDAPYPTNIPHPQLLELPDHTYLMVTFNGASYGHPVLGYGGHGDVVFMRSHRFDRGT